MQVTEVKKKTDFSESYNSNNKSNIYILSIQVNIAGNKTYN